MNSVSSKIIEWFYKERNYILSFWIMTGIVFFIDAFWFHPTTRHIPIVRFVEFVLLHHPLSPLELFQQLLNTIMIWFVWKAKDEGAFKGFEVFRISFVILLILVWLEEISWGQVLHRYPWPEAIAPFMEHHADVHNVMIGRADIADLMEALAAVFTCVLLAFPTKHSSTLIPSLPLTRSSFHMLAFSFLISPLSMIREVNEQDIIFENAIFASLSMGILAGIGKLKTQNDAWEDQSSNHRAILWMLVPLPWIKFLYLVFFGHYPAIPIWP